MEHQLKLTARGYAVCELMVNQGLTLEDACAQVEHELETLRQTVDGILTKGAWEDVPGAMQAALDGVSLRLQNAYLEESARSNSAAPSPTTPWHGSAALH